MGVEVINFSVIGLLSYYGKNRKHILFPYIYELTESYLSCEQNQVSYISYSLSIHNMKHVLSISIIVHGVFIYVYWHATRWDIC